MLYILTTVWLLRTPNTNQNIVFHAFGKQAENEENGGKIEPKNGFFLHPNGGRGFNLQPFCTFVSVNRILALIPCFYL